MTELLARADCIVLTRIEKVTPPDPNGYVLATVLSTYKGSEAGPRIRIMIGVGEARASPVVVNTEVLYFLKKSKSVKDAYDDAYYGRGTMPVTLRKGIRCVKIDGETVRVDRKIAKPAPVYPEADYDQIFFLGPFVKTVMRMVL